MKFKTLIAGAVLACSLSGAAQAAESDPQYVSDWWHQSVNVVGSYHTRFGPQFNNDVYLEYEAFAKKDWFDFYGYLDLTNFFGAGNSNNLIGNAMLHTPEGSLVDVLLHRVAGKTVIDIVDNGPGMPESFIERAFDRFTRSPDVKAQGSGLGLSIVRNVAQKHQIHVALSNCLTPQGAICGLQVRVTLP